MLSPFVFFFIYFFLLNILFFVFILLAIVLAERNNIGSSGTSWKLLSDSTQTLPRCTAKFLNVCLTAKSRLKTPRQSHHPNVAVRRLQPKKRWKHQKLNKLGKNLISKFCFFIFGVSRNDNVCLNVCLFFHFCRRSVTSNSFPLGWENKLMWL